MNARTIVRLCPVLIPSLITLSLFLCPLGMSLWQSFHSYSGEFVGLGNYTDMFSDQRFQDAIVYTLRITLVVLLVTLVSSIILAMALRRTFIGKKMMLFLLQYDVAVPSLACASMMIFLLSQGGFLSAVLNNLGLIGSYTDFPEVFFKSNGLGVMVSIIWLFVPYITLSLLAVLHSVSNDQEDQAATLGVGKLKRFFYITLPTIKPAIAYTSILCFASVFGAFELPSLVGDEHTLVTLAYYYYTNYVGMDGFMESYSLSVLVTLVSLVVSTFFMYYSISLDERRSE